jgi:hypothetical protein
MRAASVKHAEYEILKAILTTPMKDYDLNHHTLCGNSLDGVATKRFSTAVRNIRKVLANMGEKRMKYLPDEHEDYGDTFKEILDSHATQQE